MFNILKQFFDKGPAENLNELFAEGAIVVDVRSKAEFAGGHLPKSINIPLPQLQNGGLKVQKDKAIITCCASGARSATAKRWLESNGYSKVINGGSWLNLRQYQL